MKDNKDEQFPIVDENGNLLGAVSRGHAHDGSKILHPVVHLHVFNSKGELYLQHRPEWKDIQPIYLFLTECTNTTAYCHTSCTRAVNHPILFIEIMDKEQGLLSDAINCLQIRSYCFCP